MPWTQKKPQIKWIIPVSPSSKAIPLCLSSNSFHELSLNSWRYPSSVHLPSQRSPLQTMAPSFCSPPLWPRILSSSVTSPETLVLPPALNIQLTPPECLSLNSPKTYLPATPLPLSDFSPFSLLQPPRLYILTNSEKHPPLQLPETLLHNGFCRFLGIFLPRVDLSLVLQFHYSDSQQPTRNQHMALWNCDTWQNRLHENRAPYGGLQRRYFVRNIPIISLTDYKEKIEIYTICWEKI